METGNTKREWKPPHLGDNVFCDVLVGEVRGLDQLAGDRGVGLVKGLPMELWCGSKQSINIGNCNQKVLREEAQARETTSWKCHICQYSKYPRT